MNSHPALRGAVVLGLLQLTTAALANNVSFSPTIAGNAPSAAANADIVNAFNKLATFFDSTAPFNMTATVTWKDLGASTLGTSGTSTSSYQNEGGTLYINPLDRFIYGDKPGVTTGSGYKDMEIELNNNSSINWDYTLATPSNFSANSLASVLYHEGLHSMGATSAIDANGALSFGAPTIWSKFVADGSGTSVATMTDSQRAAAITAGDGTLFFTGPNAKAANGGNNVKLYAPSTYEDGSSDGSHISPTQSGAGLLYPSLPNGVYFEPTNLELSMMKDIGWRTAVVPAPSGLAVALIGLVPGVSILLRRRKR